MKLLLDENLSHKLRTEIVGHEIFTAAYMGWNGVENGELLELAAREGFEVLITNDRALEYEQDQVSLAVAVVVLLVRANTIEAIRPLLEDLHGALRSIKPRQLIKIGQ